jgi:hypothetical protein
MVSMKSNQSLIEPGELERQPVLADRVVDRQRSPTINGFVGHRSQKVSRPSFEGPGVVLN